MEGHSLELCGAAPLLVFQLARLVSCLVVMCGMLLYSYGIGFHSSCSGGKMTILFLLPSSCGFANLSTVVVGWGLLFSFGMGDSSLDMVTYSSWTGEVLLLCL